jgi:NAD(P)-dependent dehydrogenase (short-subunit alcohol dehydrogenase family)
MTDLKGKSGVVLGASSGVGQATLRALASQGMRVWGVARDHERLARIVREAPGEAVAVAEDATRPELAARLFREADPDLVVVCVGARPRLAPVDEQTWESFSLAWNTDVKAAFHVCQEAVRRPLRPGSVVVIVSSGAAIAGSPLSGGYAGAKRMQWFLAGYMQKISDARKLGIRFVTVVPKQLIVGTEIADTASAAYANESGITQEKFMARFEQPLMPEGVADAIVRIARSEADIQGAAIGVTGKGVERL